MYFPGITDTGILGDWLEDNGIDRRLAGRGGDTVTSFDHGRSMRIIDEAELARIRAMSCCWCGRPPPSEPHHYYARGIGSGSRLDVAINLAPLCLECHYSHHNGKRPLREDLLACIAAREGWQQDEMVAEIWRLIRS